MQLQCTCTGSWQLGVSLHLYQLAAILHIMAGLASQQAQHSVMSELDNLDTEVSST